MDAYLSKSCITVNEVTGFDLNFQVDENKRIEVKNPHGYSAEDVPDIGSGEVLEDTTFFYVLFQYGDDANSIAAKIDSANIKTECDEENWKVSSATDPIYGLYWKVIAAATHVLGSVHNDSIEHVVTFKSIKCNSQIGKTAMTLSNLTLIGNGDKIELTIKKVPQPNLSNLAIEGSGPFNFGGTLQLSWDVYDYTSFRITLDDMKVTQQDKHYETEPLPVKYEAYVVSVKNEAGSVLRQRISCNISAILDFEIVEIHEDSVTFQWKADANNVLVCLIATIATNIKLEGKSKFDATITSDQTFTFLAVLKDRRNIVSKEIQFLCPFIEDFNVVSNEACEDTDGVRNCRKTLEGKVKDGFLSADYLHTHLDDDKVFFPCHLSCKSGPTPTPTPTTYQHKYTWSGKNVDKYYFVMDTGEKSQEYGADVQEGEITTQSENAGATLYAVDKYGYEVNKHT